MFNWIKNIFKKKEVKKQDGLTEEQRRKVMENFQKSLAARRKSQERSRTRGTPGAFGNSRYIPPVQFLKVSLIRKLKRQEAARVAAFEKARGVAQ